MGGDLAEARRRFEEALALGRRAGFEEAVQKAKECLKELEEEGV